MDMRLKKLMALKKKGDKGMSESDMMAKHAALGDLMSMAKEAMGSKLKGLKKVTVASDSEEGLETGLELAKKKLGDMKASDESEIPKTGHGMGEGMMEEGEEMMEEDDSEEEESSEQDFESMSEEELKMMMEKAKAALAKKKMDI